MNSELDSSQPSESRKRSGGSESGSGSPLSKRSKVDDEQDRVIDSSDNKKDGEKVVSKSDSEPVASVTTDAVKPVEAATSSSSSSNSNSSSSSSDSRAKAAADSNSNSELADSAAELFRNSKPQEERSDSAAIAAAEALASLTGSGEKDEKEEGDGVKELPCSSKQAYGDKKDKANKINRPGSSKEGRKHAMFYSAAAADSSSSPLKCAERAEEEEENFLEEDEDEEDSLSGSLSSSTASSSVASDNEDAEDVECAIVSVKMAPEVRQSVALLAQVQMRLDALEKKSARLHQRLELKLSRQRRPHLDQRGAITQNIPGFWVTALLNHPHLSVHIDESDEDALSYMTNLEIETFKNNKLGYRICFHFRRNPFFQNKVLVKELHLGMGGSPVSFSNPILWHRGQNLIGSGEPRQTSRGVYQSFFHWFGDHSSPGRDDIAQILKDDLYRNPLRYYLTPLWEPRENGSTPKPPDNSNGDECVIISDSDDEQEAISQDQRPEEKGQDDGEEGRAADSDDSDHDRVGESSFEEDREEEDVNVEEVDESRDSAQLQDQDQEEDEQEIDVHEGEDLEEEN